MASIIFTLFSLCFINVALGQTLTSDGCYREYKNYKVTCMVAYTTQVADTLEACGAICTQNAQKCKAAQLDPVGNCQLFDAAVSTTNTGRRKRASGCYGYGPSLISAPGSCYMLPTGYGCTGGVVTTTTMAPSDPTTPPTVPTPPTQPTPPTPPTDTTTMATDPTTTTTTAMGTTTTQGTVSSDSPVPAEATCPSGKEVRYTYVEGYQLSGTPDATFNAASEQECTTACTNNKTPDGKQVPCRSADYNSKTQQCSISLQLTPPVGTVKADANPDSKHFEKVCIDAAVAQNCQGAYFRAPQHILIGFAQAVATASSTAECLELCATSQTRFGFACSSGMYYFEESTNNCILNSETRTTNTELFVPEETDGVEYFEPGCTSTRHARQVAPPKKRNRNILKLNSDTFGAWTMCDKVNKDHMRFRQCTSVNPNRCQIDLNGCDPAKENDYDLEKDLKAPKGKLVMSKHTGPTTTTKAGQKPATAPPLPAPSTSKKPATAPPLPPPTTTGKPAGPGQCVPTVRSDGSMDCSNGVRVLPNGRKQGCNPNKKECDDEKTRQKTKQKDKKGPR